jgi:rod shape-determining protein MreB and related proteins
VRVGGDKMDEAIVQYIKRKYNLLVGERTAELIKITIGNGLPRRRDPDDGDQGPRSGRRRAEDGGGVNSDEIRDSLLEPINADRRGGAGRARAHAARAGADIVDKGIVLAGGGALLRNLDVLLREETGLPMVTGRRPAARRGDHGNAGKVLDERWPTW